MIAEIIDKTLFRFSICIRMPYNKTLKFDKINIEKCKYHILDKKKYFVNSLVVLEIKMISLNFFIKLPKLKEYLKMFRHEDNQNAMLDTRSKIWSKIWSLTKNDIDAELVYREKSLKYKVKFYKKVMKVDFHDNKLPPKISSGMVPTTRLIDSFSKNDKTMWTQIQRYILISFDWFWFWFRL